MSKQPETQYWHLIAQSMDVEDSKLSLYVRHKHSLGVGRETILRGVLASQTPEPFRVKTGFIAGVNANDLVTSDQCDILVYNPTISQPFYRIDEFVVVPWTAARIAIEVRSKLTVGTRRDTGNGTKPKISGLDQMFKIWKSMTGLQTQVFGFGYTGVKFDDFALAVATRMGGNIFTVPECIVVHKQNYICVRVTSTLRKPAKPDPRLCIAIDFSVNDVARPGLATAYFLSLYDDRVRNREAFAIENVRFLARDLKIPDAAIRIIDENGQTRNGPIPE